MNVMMMASSGLSSGAALFRGVSALPEHLRHGAIGREMQADYQEDHGVVASERMTLQVPLDHFDAKSSVTWPLKFYVNAATFQPGGVVLVTMPSEAATLGCGAGALARALQAVAICSEHRYFGDSVPLNDSSTSAFSRYLSVEQNLADVAALIRHVRTRLYPSATATVVTGGSYAGASSVWMRRTYPSLVGAAIAHSPPVTAMYDFEQYDVSNLVALSSPDSRCAQTQARVAHALTSLLRSDASKVFAIFGAEHYAATGQVGLTDFMYALADSSASAVQYGRKQLLCDALRPAYEWPTRASSGTEKTEKTEETEETEEEDDDDESRLGLARLFANYTRSAWGPSFFSQCFYNSTCMRTSTRGNVAQAARSWYWMKCHQLGYLQVAPRTGLSTRPKGLTLERLLAQCAHIFGDAATRLSRASVGAFNQKFGGQTLGGTTRIFEIDYSDDPWKMATTVSAVTRQNWPLRGAEQPFMLLTCDGCGHCGAGVPAVKREAITQQAVAYLRRWGVAPRLLAARGEMGGTDREKMVEAEAAEKDESSDEERHEGGAVEEAMLSPAAANAAAASTAKARVVEELAPLVIDASESLIRYHGRWSFDYPPAKGAAACAWPMSGFSFAIAHAPGCRARLTAPGDGARLLVRVDGSVTRIVSTNEKAEPTAWYELADGLDPSRTHTVEVFKVTEDNTRGATPPGVLLLHSIELPPGGQMLTAAAAGGPPLGAPRRRLEFIGDSDTAGWCADGKSSGGGDAPDSYENAYETWAMQLARRVKASEVMVEAVSGYGVTPSSGRIQDLYASTLAFTPQPAPVWNFSSWIPDAVVILIGPNDERRRRLAAWPRLSRALVEGISPVTSADFVSAYLELCTLVATRYATAPVPPKLVHVCGGSINGLDPCEDIQTAIAAFNKEWRKSATRSHYASITVEHWNEINDPSHEFLGCDSHYGPKGHAVLAQDIAPQLEAIMGWS